MTRKQVLALFTLCFAVLLISIDNTVLNVALPVLVQDLHPSSSGLQWIADGYTLTNAVLLLFFGAMGDRYGRRLMFILGLTIFGVGSLVCALVHSTGPLIGARILMGLGAATLLPSTLAIIASTFTGRDRARAIGIWAGSGGIGAAAGPVLGGFLLDHFWWGSVFLINVPVVVVALVLAFVAIDESRSENPLRISVVSVVLSSLGLAALTFGLIESSSTSWGSPQVIGSLAAAVVLLAAFLRWDSRRPEPMIDLQLFRIPVFSSGLGVVTALFLAMFGVSFLFGQYLQFVLEKGELAVGLCFVPFAVSNLIGSYSATTLSERFGLRRTLLFGVGCVLAGVVQFAFVPVGQGYLRAGIAFVFMGLGGGIAIAPASTAVMSVLPMAKIGLGSGLRSTVQLLGGTLGVAIIGTLTISGYRSRAADVAVPAQLRGAVHDQLGTAYDALKNSPHSEAALSGAQHAFTHGVRISSLTAAGVVAVAMALAARYVPKQVGHATAQPAAEPVGVAA